MASRPATPPSVPEGQRVYAIGDIHGRADLLASMLASIEADLDRAPAAEVSVILTGDYVDRGPSSPDVLDRLMGHTSPGRMIALRGNHEAMLLRFLDEPESVASLWIRLGGLETLHSYQVDVRELRRGRGVAEAAESFRRRIPPRHVEFLDGLPLSATVGDYFFCHAGVRPGVPLDRQREQDLLWIREEFLASDHRFEKVVVHGHTPVERPELRSNRINIDTGAYISGRLTCVVLEGTEQRFLWT